MRRVRRCCGCGFRSRGWVRGAKVAALLAVYSRAAAGVSGCVEGGPVCVCATAGALWALPQVWAGAYCRALRMRAWLGWVQ